MSKIKNYLSILFQNQIGYVTVEFCLLVCQQHYEIIHCTDIHHIFTVAGSALT